MKYIKHVPNILTVIRLILVPVIILFISMDNYLLAFIIFTLSAITDVVDGIIARKFNAISDFGKLIDPLADKLTQISVLLTLSIKEIIPFWIICVLLVKELILIIGASFLYGKNLVVSSKWYGKLTTVIMYLAVVSSFAIKAFNLPHFDIYLYSIAVILAIFSLFSYTRYFYGQGYLPNKEELKESTKVKEFKKD